jgi:hypothetical protein
MLVLILALGHGPQPSPAPDPSASPRTDVRAAVASVGDTVTGAWKGEWAEAEGRAPVGLEAAFRTGSAGTVFGYFTFIERGVRRTVLRQGVSAADGVRFWWPEGRRLELRLTDFGRLQGHLVPARPEEGAGAPAGSVSLSRVPR